MVTDKDKKDDKKIGKGDVLGNNSEETDNNDEPQLKGREIIYKDGRAGGFFPGV